MQRLDKTQTWDVVRQERARLVRDLRGVDPEKLSLPSPCPGWDVHDVVAHLVDTALTTRTSFLADMALARFDFDRANARGVARRRRSLPEETIESMAATVGLRRTPPAPLATRLVEMIVHGEDVRRPLGIAADYPPEAVIQALDHQLRTSTAMGGAREHVAGLRLSASDVDLDHGDETATLVSGPALELLLLVSGRHATQPTSSGSGWDVLRARTVA